jgi:hypothetical protein
MARTRAVIFSTILTNEDFRRLTTGAQWLYMVLLLQPKLSLAGCMVMQPSRWAGVSTDADVGPWLDELEQAGYVVTDDETNEVVIRSFVEQDVLRTNIPVTTIKGVWSAWLAIESDNLRRVVVDNMPGVIWARSVEFVPVEATQMRRSTPIEPPDQTAGPDHPYEPPVQAAGSYVPTPTPTPLPGAGCNGRFEPLDLIPADRHAAMVAGIGAARARLTKENDRV